MSQNSLIKKPVEKFSFFEMFLLVLIFSQGVFYIFMWSQLLSNPLLKTMDFISLYGTGRLIREGNYQLIYNYDAEADVQRQVVGDKDYSPLIFNHPPHVTPLLGLIANRNYVLAYIYWSILRLLVLLLCTEMIRRSFLQLGWKARDAILGALGYVVFFPVFISLLGGQDTIFTLTGLLIWMFALLRMQDVKAGMGLAFATLTPTVAGAVALPLLVSRRKAGVWFFLGVSILAVYGFLLVGKDGSLEFLNLLKTSSEGVYYGINWEAMFNFLGLLLRAFPLLGLDLVKLIAWGGGISFTYVYVYFVVER